MDGNFWGLIIAAVLTAIFGVLIAGQNARMSRKLETNHGKTIGQHVEDAARAADEANLNAQLVQLQLEKYKADQASIQQREHDLIQRYVEDDAKAHAELRAMLVQVALDKQPPASGDAAEK